MKKFSITYLIVTFLCACGGGGEKICPDVNCANYATQAQAQVAFDADRDCLGELDNDSDGIACEQVFTSGGTGGTVGSGTSGCPTTSNCGCSGYNKSACGGSCCKWIVGTGCRCK